MSFFCIQRGMAVVDTAVGQPLMGIESMNELREELNEKGFDLVYVKKSDLPTARGVGGSSRPLGVAFVPVSIGGIEGIVEFVVIQERIPPLLSIGLLKGFKAFIDLGEEKMSVTKDEQQGSASLVELATGHHAIGIVADDPEGFSFPEGFLESYNYDTSDFKFRHQHNESSLHDTIDAIFTRCHCLGDCERGSVVHSINVGCQAESDSVDNYAETHVDMSQQEYLSDKSQSREHGTCIDRYHMLSILARMSPDGSLSSLSSTSDINQIHAFSAQQVVSCKSLCASHESSDVDASGEQCVRISYPRLL